MQFFKPENYFLVRKALLDANRKDLIGDGCTCLIPATPPKEALKARIDRANRDADHVHSRARMPGQGYRPGRNSARRRDRDS